MINKLHIKFFCIFILAFFLASCNLSPIKIASEYSYTITQWPKNNFAPAHAKTEQTLLVTSPIAAPGFTSSRMVYVLIPYQLRSFADHRWVAPPSYLLLPLLANRLREAGYFKAVVTSPFSGSATYQLNTELLTLQQEFLKPQSQVRLTMVATLVQVTDGHVVASRVFTIVIPTKENNPYGGVLATNQAAHDMMREITNFVVRNVKEHARNNLNKWRPKGQ